MGGTPRTPLYSTPQKGTVGETALDTLTLLLTCGDLHMAQPLPDDARIDRVLFRPAHPSGKAIQIKSPTYLIRGQYLSLRIRAPTLSRNEASNFFVLAAHQVAHSPWVDDSFYLIPATALPARPPTGWWRLSLPRDPKRPGKYGRYRHPLRELGSVLSEILDGGRAYPFPPSKADLRRLTPPGHGKVLENEAACLFTVLSDGELHVWRPFVDDFGEDLGVTDESMAASLRIQIKGCLGLDRDRRVTAHIQQRTFRESRFNLVVILWYDVPALRLGDYGWVFRTDELADLGLARDAEGSYRFGAPAAPSKRSPMQAWQYPVEEVPAVLQTALELIRERGPGVRIPTRRDQVRRARAR
jgi:hypothetical protein